MQIYPVIHHLNFALSLEQVALAHDCGADGVFLISHDGKDDEVLWTAAEAKARVKQQQAGTPFHIGINLLSQSAVYACMRADDLGLDMVWADDMGVDSTGGNQEAETLACLGRASPEIRLFASVAFKYRPPEPDPPRAALIAQRLGFIPTTSGEATGHAPDVGKIAAMSAATQGELAIASGMTPENVASYAPYLSHILVATGVGLDEHRIDPARLRLLIENARAAA